ncbi:hypothetical protein O6H91_07G102300 [Diphasiastrum complanatum]|uniref:Uncharacterized protein n=2 Tax=Diphasiastrum complanatum TaxID=34168 RepID=A0ACC2D7Y2_DIPCM|nr:hypothetical protein O6H91_07G102100 [Diphasiastrum complanatum]KAJ7550457.1 hypothetical protein O6H91_07G102300 [Diphasiastrum complanatum]
MTNDSHTEFKQVDELLVKLKTHKQEAIDCLIASRAAYEPTLDGVADVLERSYEVDTSRYELLYHHEQPTFLSARLLDNQEQIYAIIRSSNGYVMVAFRGTFTLQDAIQDMKLTTAPVGFGLGVGRAHVGFQARAEKMPVQLFMNLTRPGEKLIFTGHSLGGAVASLTTLRVLEALSAAGDDAPISRERVLCVTFGTAPFANRELAMYINSKYRDRFYHLVSMHDFVPRAHNILPRLFFPLAQRFSHNLRQSKQFQAAQRFFETASGTAVHKSIKRLEAVFRALCPLTGFIDFVRDCIANDEEALFYGLCGYVLLFNPDAKDSEHIVQVDQMENMTPGFCTEGKTTLEVLFEHGLGNHYSLIMQGLFDRDVSKADSKEQRSISGTRYTSLHTSMKNLSTSIMPFLSDPASAFLFHVARLLLLLVNNDLPGAPF